MPETVPITINDQDFEAPAGAPLIDVIQELTGEEVPRFCYHRDLPVVGSCRMCQVEVEAPGPGGALRKALAISCRTPVAKGMKIWTQTPAAQTARKGVLEFLLKDHPLDCPICDKAGECPLQNFTYQEGQSEGRSVDPRRKRRKRVSLGDVIVLDEERCVLCSRCVRFFPEVEGRTQLQVLNMGNRSHIGTFDNQPLQGNYQGNLADICPVGALTLKDFRFQARVWNTHSVPSTCTRCSRGCAVMVDAYRGRLVRIRPRYDAKVNRSWMCDFGRFQLQDLNLPGRLSGAIQEQQQGLRELPLEQALETAAENLRAEASQSFLLASNYATLEVGQALMELAKSLQTEAYFLKPSAWGGDGILRTDDPGPNSFGLQELGLKALAPDQARERLAAAEASLLVGEKLLPLLLQQDPTAGSTLPPIDTGRTAILVDTHLRSGFALTLPGLTWAETQGRVKNLDGHTRILRPALPGPDGVPQTHDLVQSLCARVRRDPDAHSTPNLQPSGMPV